MGNIAAADEILAAAHSGGTSTPSVYAKRIFAIALGSQAAANAILSAIAMGTTPPAWATQILRNTID